MSCVVVVADKPDKVFLRQLHGMLSRFFSSLLLCGRELAVAEERPELIIADAESVESVVAEKQLLIYKDLRTIDTGKLSFQNAIAIVDSSNNALLSFVSSTRLPVITCGLSVRDTITLSSIGTDSAVVNLQRSVQCMDNSIAEPQELPVMLSGPTDHFVLMATAAVLLLFGQSDRLMKAGLTD